LAKPTCWCRLAPVCASRRTGGWKSLFSNSAPR
jgi:hypothetical protein